MATKQPKNEVAEVNKNELMFDQGDVPEYLKNGTGRGSENVGVEDMVLPRLEIVQAQSPIKDENPEAAEGLLFNTATGEVIGDIAYIVPIFYRMEYLVWRDQDEGGGFFGSFPTRAEGERRAAEVAVNDRIPSEQLEVTDTPVHFCLRIRPDMTTEQIVISMAKSKAKVSRKWNSLVQMMGGDRFSRVYKLTTFKDKNKQNKTFFNYVVQPAGFTPEKIYRDAEKQYDLFSTNGATVNHEAAGRAAGSGDGATEERHETDDIGG